MCTNLLKDSRTFSFLLQIDRDTETTASQEPCAFCGDRVHRAYYLRKPRAPGVDLSDDFCRRPSFSCRRDGCRRRKTPALLRFLGRKVYVSIVVLLVTAMTQGDSPRRLSELKKELGIPPATVDRWRRFWLEIFPRYSSWHYQRGNVVPPIDEANLPLSLLQHLTQQSQDQLEAVVSLLRLALHCSMSPPPQSSQ
ncbi:MAG: hypothetical protein EHM87_22650 [Burkholderiales bacterium]|nr:MAG: hypothetical protein EHM87_22650 [Burkholderiales bacterium]